MRRHRGNDRAERLDRIGLGQRDVGVVAGAVFFVVAAGDRKLLDVERVGADLVEDRARTDAFSPWISDTTAMIEVTATMLPSTVMNDRSLRDQIASSAIATDSRIWSWIRILGELRRARCGRFVTFTVSPSAIWRTESNGPVTTWSPALEPDSTSK